MEEGRLCEALNLQAMENRSAYVKKVGSLPSESSS